MIPVTGASQFAKKLWLQQDGLSLCRRAKGFVMEALTAMPGQMKLKVLSRERLIQFRKDRARQGAGPVPISMDIGYLKLVVSHAAAVYGIDISPEPVGLARIAQLGRRQVAGITGQVRQLLLGSTGLVSSLEDGAAAWLR